MRRMMRDEIAKAYREGRERLTEEAEQMAAKAGQGREEMAQRAEEIRERFAQNATPDMMTNFAGWTFVSTGVALGVSDWARGKRSAMNLILPVVLMVMGATVLSGGFAWRRRSAHIGEAESRMLEELHSLGPVARMQVLRHVAGQSMPLVHRMSARN